LKVPIVDVSPEVALFLSRSLLGSVGGGADDDVAVSEEIEILLGNDKKDPETEKRQHGKKSCRPQKRLKENPRGRTYEMKRSRFSDRMSHLKNGS
jgi:hypothetical protein